jgi:paraquat-inducible protein B
MLLMLSLLIALAVAFFGFRAARRFVRDRLRFVEAAQRASAPWIAGLVALLVGLLVVAPLPWVGAGTAITFALAIGGGVAAGARDVRTGRHLLQSGE